MIYIRKVINQDVTGQIGLTQNVARYFFECGQNRQDHRITFVYKGKNNNLPEQDSPINVDASIHWYPTSEPRFNGDLKSLLMNAGVAPGDILIINKGFGDVYELSIFTQVDSHYSAYNLLFGNDNHQIIYEEGNEDEHAFMQKIFYGAPGTGKSYLIEKRLFGEGANVRGLDSIPEHHKFRTTFHPDYDYAQFVGSYKPVEIESNLKDELLEIVRGARSSGLKTELLNRLEREESLESTISYRFNSQVFAKAYIAAWIAFLRENRSPVYLVIEEINRGNCAQIFGDVFQLLDRKNGWSEYPIDADPDFAKFILDRLQHVKLYDREYDLRAEYVSAISNLLHVGNCPIDKFSKIALPPNLNIIATMNTSDQSLFPMDSAFKRRFDWMYVPIRYKKEELPLGAQDNWDVDEIEICVYPESYAPRNGEKIYKRPLWTEFLQKINKDIRNKTFSEDKQMGEFFVKAKTIDENGTNHKIIDFNTFRSKVLFYLWDSVYKDYVDSSCFFNPEGNESSVIYFQDLYKSDERAVSAIEKMMEYLDAAVDPSNKMLVRIPAVEPAPAPEAVPAAGTEPALGEADSDH